MPLESMGLIVSNIEETMQTKENVKIYNQMSFIDTEQQTVLMSLREEYYNAMLDGSKKYEYRTRYLKEKK